MTRASRRARSAVRTLTIDSSMRPERQYEFTIDCATMFGEMYVVVAMSWTFLMTAFVPTR